MLVVYLLIICLIFIHSFIGVLSVYFGSAYSSRGSHWCMWWRKSDDGKWHWVGINLFSVNEWIIGFGKLGLGRYDEIWFYLPQNHFGVATLVWRPGKRGWGTATLQLVVYGAANNSLDKTRNIFSRRNGVYDRIDETWLPYRI